MKIVHINTYQTGGAAVACQRLNKALNEYGVQSDMLVLYKTEPEKNTHDFRESLSILQYWKTKMLNKWQIIRQQREISKQSPDELFSFPNSIWRLEEHELLRKADIVHLHWVAGFLDYASFFHAVKKPIVWTLHDFEPFSTGYHYPNAQRLALEHDHHKIKKSALEGRNIHVAAPSSYIMEQAVKSSLFRTFPAVRIPNDFPADPYKYYDQAVVRARFSIGSTKPVVLFVGENFDYQRKGYLRIEPYFEEIADQLDIMLIGGTHKNAQYQFDYQTDESQFSQLIACADLLIFPSADENFSNLIIECLLCGTPVVAFDVGGNGEILNKKNSLLCDLQEGMIKSILRAASRKWDRKEIAEDAKKRFFNKAVGPYVGLYQSILSRF